MKESLCRVFLCAILATMVSRGIAADVVTNAVPPVGKAFVKWSGEVPDALAYRNPLVLPEGSGLNIVAVFGDAIHVTTNGNSQADGSSWTNATTLKSAVANAESGMVILLADGIYNAGAELSIPAGVTLRSSGGDRDSVTISGGLARRVITLAAGSVLADVTVADAMETSARKGYGVDSTGGIISNCRITNCRAYSYAIGVAVYNNGGKVYGSLIDKNGVKDDYGVYGSYRNGELRGAYYQSGAGAICEGTVVAENKFYGVAKQWGGTAIWMGAGVIRNCSVVSNSFHTYKLFDSDFAGAVYVADGSFENNAVCDNNWFGSRPEGVFAVMRAGGTVANCVIIGNGPGGTNNWSGSAAAYKNCYTSPVTGQDGGILGDGGAYVTVDAIPRPFASSPLIDAGAALSASSSNSVDILGAGRIAGNAVDIGPVEYSSSGALACLISATAYKGFDSLEATLCARAVGDTSGIAYSWDLDGDGIIDATGATASLSLSTLGSVTVTLSALNAAGEAASYSREFEVIPSRIYVCANNADAAAPYATPATAAANIKTAVDFAPDGCEVILCTGTHTISGARIILDKAVTVCGETGNRNDVTVSGAGFLLYHSGATVKDLTLRGHSGGSWYNLAGGISIFGGGLAENCRITGRVGSSTGVLAVRNYNGIVRGCLIDGNTGTDSYPDSVNCPLFSQGPISVTEQCVISNNVINSCASGAWSAGVYVENGLVRNCLIIDNKISFRGIAPQNRIAVGVRQTGGRLQNCTVFGNTFSGVPQENVFGVVRSGGEVVNCLIAQNLSSALEPLNWSGDATAFVACATTPIDGIEGGVSTEADLFWLDGLLPIPSIGSALVDAGQNSGANFAGDHDLLGNSRLCGESLDIGALEMNTNSLSCSFSAPSYDGFDSISLTLSAQTTGDTAGLVCEWDLDGDGIFETTGEEVDLNLSSYGESVISLRVSNAAGEVAKCHRTFSLYASRIFVVNGNPNAAQPYATFESAAPNIHDALEIAGNGSEIIVSNGTYSLNSSIVLRKAVSVRGFSGDRNDVVFDANYQCIPLIIYSEGASFSSATLYHGTGDCISGILLNKGLVSNLCVRACEMRHNGGSSSFDIAASVLNTNGRFLRSEIVQCNFHEWYKTQLPFGHLYQRGNDAYSEGCVITNNTNTGKNNTGSKGGNGSAGVFIAGGVIRNCIIAKNSMLMPNPQAVRVYGVGAYVYGGLVENCTIVENSITEQTSYNHTYASVYLNNGSIKNTLIAQNTRATDNYEYPAMRSSAGTGEFNYCCLSTPEGLPGENNIEASGDHLYFFDETTGLFGISASSPCWGSGLTEPWMASALDVYGNKRLSGHVDIGAVEFMNPRALFLILR